MSGKRPAGLPAKDLPFGRTLLYAAVTVCTFFAILEGSARVFCARPERTVYEEHQQIISVLGLPELNETMEYDPYLFWTLKPNLDNELVSGRIRDHDICFSVSTNGDRLRSPAISGKGRRYRILTIGDSSTFGLGVNDEETWPAQLQRLMNQTLGGIAEVINAGVPGYTAFQGRRFLEKYGLRYEPDLVIATFGFNDSDVWSSRSDSETARALQISRWEMLLRESRFYAVMRGLLREGWHRRERSTGGKNPRLSPEEFRQALREIHDVCSSRNVPVIFLIWPYRKQVTGEAPDLLLYQPIVAQVGSEAAAPVVSLVGPFAEAEVPPFIDHVHANSGGCRIVARTIADLLGRARIR